MSSSLAEFFKNQIKNVRKKLDIFSQNINRLKLIISLRGETAIWILAAFIEEGECQCDITIRVGARRGRTLTPDVPGGGHWSQYLSDNFLGISLRRSRLRVFSLSLPSTGLLLLPNAAPAPCITTTIAADKVSAGEGGGGRRSAHLQRMSGENRDEG